LATLGLISDTHDLLRPEALQALAGVDRILHAGDICSPGILDALAAIAPVTAVRGNNDRGAWAEMLAERETLRVDDVSILIVHDLATLRRHPPKQAADVVVCGHSHRPMIETRDGVLYVNPGSAGPRRFKLPVAIAFLQVAKGKAEARLRQLRIAAQ
jgi:uncharacterized protein